jgi:pimeloyl-ACP methyl ester carboxylesterase
MMVIRALAVALPALVQATDLPGQSGGGRLRFEPLVLELTDGTKVSAERGRLTVPERRGAAQGRTIDLAVIRLRSTAERPGAPIVYLNGSPGGAPASAVVRMAEFHSFFSALRSAGDVVVLDYRGTGMSSPRLDCPPSSSVHPGAFLARDSALALFRDVAEGCARHLRASGADLAGYTWVEVADDVSDLRRALGAGPIHLVGFSSGTHAALATLKRHESEIGRVALLGTEGPDHTRKLPSNIDRQLRQVDRLVAADSALSGAVPSFASLVDSVLTRLDREPVTVEVELRATKERVRVPVGRFALEFLTAKSLSGPDEFAVLPTLYYTIARGDLSMLTRAVQRWVNRPPPNALAYVMDGASGVSPARAARIEREATHSVLHDAANFPFPEIRDAWHYEDLGAAYRAPLRTSVPALFVTGELDGNTPPHQAEEVRRGFRRSTHLVIKNGGHSSVMTTPAASAAIAAFLRGESVDQVEITVPRPKFTPIPR